MKNEKTNSKQTEIPQTEIRPRLLTFLNAGNFKMRRTNNGDQVLLYLSDKVAIAIHKNYFAKILSGEKRGA